MSEAREDASMDTAAPGRHASAMRRVSLWSFLPGTAFVLALMVPLRVPVELRNQTADALEVRVGVADTVRLGPHGTAEVRVRRWATTPVEWVRADERTPRRVELPWTSVVRLRSAWIPVGR
jgi:hypothetical protein